MTQPSLRTLFRDYGLTIAGAVLLALAIRFFLIEAYKIPGAAMRPALLPGDTLFVAKAAFGMRMPGNAAPFTEGRMPRYGEVVVYQHPGDVPRDSIKRVLGLPGDTVEMTRGRLKLNGKEVSLSERSDSNCGTETLEARDGTLPPKVFTVCWEAPLPEPMTTRTLGPSEILLAADSRSQSYEGRRQPPWVVIPLSALRGSALWIWLSVEPERGAGGTLFARMRFERMFKPVE